MIKHIVMWKLKESSEGHNKKSLAHQLKEKLEKLVPLIPEITRLEVGIDHSDSPQASDIVLCSEFPSWEALESYRIHPDHQAVAQWLGTITLERRVVDYETD